MSSSSLVRKQIIQFHVILLLFILFCFLLLYVLNVVFIANNNNNMDAPAWQMQAVTDARAHTHTNVSTSIPVLWIFGPAKTSTTSVSIGIVSSFPNWCHPQSNKPYNEYHQLWSKHIWQQRINALFQHRLLQFMNESIIFNTSMRSAQQYPFKQILSLLFNDDESLIYSRLQSQNAILKSKDCYRDHHGRKHVIVKTPSHIYSPFIPILFAHYLSPTAASAGTNIIIFLRDSVKRTISWYSLFYIKRFVAAFNGDEDGMFELVRRQMNTSLYYPPLQHMRGVLSHPKNGVHILNAYLRFYVQFVTLFKECESLAHKRAHASHAMSKASAECDAIDIGLYSADSDGHQMIEYKYIDCHRHLIHMLFVGFMYPHLLLTLTVYEQNNLLRHDNHKLKLMSFKYIIQNPKRALFMITCWSERVGKGSECQTRAADNEARIGLPHHKQETLPIPTDVHQWLTAYYEPVVEKTNDMLRRFDIKYDIFLGDWYENY